MIYLPTVLIWASVGVNVAALITGDLRLVAIGMALLGIGVMSMGLVLRR